MAKYGFIGTGNMAQAMIKGLLARQVAPADIAVSSPHTAAKLAKNGVYRLCRLSN